MAGTSSERLDFIDGLRGVAVLVVMVFHAGIWAGLGQRPMEVLSLGQRGVDLFFVISGFCMALAYIHADGIRSRDPVTFLRRRWRRIAPPYLVALALAVAVSAVMYLADGRSWFSQPMQSTFGPTAPNLIGNLLSHATFTHGFFQSYTHGIDGAFWSLATEWQFYLLLPLIVLVAKKVGVKAAVIGCVAVSVGYVLASRTISPGFITETPVGYDNILLRLVEFAAGIGCVAVLRGLYRAPRSTGLAVAALLVMAAAHHSGPMTVGPFVYAVGFSALLLAASVPGSWFHKLLVSGPMLFMGRISYSAYLIHGTVYMLVAVPFTVINAPTALREVLIMLVGPPLAVLAARQLHGLVEARATRWSHELGRRSVPARRHKST